MKPELDKLGVGMVCVVHEWIQREVGHLHFCSMMCKVHCTGAS